MKTFQLLFKWRSAWASCVSTSVPAPTIRAVSRLNGGLAISVRAHAGTNPDSFRSAAPSLAIALGVREVVIQQDSRDARRFSVELLNVSILDADYFFPTPLGVWPHGWDKPVPVGITASGSPVTVTFEENSFLIGGLPGSGKSVLASSLVSAAALDPSVHLFGIDGKGGVELGLFERVFDELCTTLPEGLVMIKGLLEEMDYRYDLMRREGTRKSAERPIFFIIDELAQMTAPGVAYAKEAKAFSDALRRLVALGRAARICPVLSTQKPSADVVDTGIRDLIQTRVAFRCTTPHASDTILGSGRASMGERADTIPASSKGRGLIINEETGHSQRFRGCFVSDHDIDKFVGLAVSRRFVAYGQSVSSRSES